MRLLWLLRITLFAALTWMAHAGEEWIPEFGRPTLKRKETHLEMRKKLQISGRELLSGEIESNRKRIEFNPDVIDIFGKEDSIMDLFMSFSFGYTKEPATPLPTTNAPSPSPSATNSPTANTFAPVTTAPSMDVQTRSPTTGPSSLQTTDQSATPSATLNPTPSPSQSVPSSASQSPSLSNTPSPTLGGSFSESPTEPSSHAPTATSQPGTESPSFTPTVVGTTLPSNTATQPPTISSSGLPSNSPSESSSPSILPSSTPEPSVMPSQSMLPSHSAVPSRIVSTFPSEPPTGEETTPAPTADLFSEAQVFECGIGGATPVSKRRTDSTEVSMSVTYLAESTGLTETFLKELEDEMLLIATTAALACPIFDGRSLRDAHAWHDPSKLERHLKSSSAVLANCNPVFDNTTCYLMETEMAFILNEKLNADLAAFRGYVAIQENMDNDYFISFIASLVRLVYLSPVPVIPPPVSKDPTTPSLPSNEVLNSPGSDFSPWTVGASVAMSVGGLMALVVWARNRRTRHRRHVELLEDVSLPGVQQQQGLRQEQV